jgi:hypothetical protein
MDGLRIYDISNPATPLNVGHSTNYLAAHAFRISVSGDAACICNWTCGMLVCDVSDKTNPINLTCIGQHGTNFGMATGVAASGGYAYVANGGDGLRIYDVSTPANPTNVGWIFSGGDAVGVALAGKYAYLANGDDGLRVYDVSDPTHPTEAGHTGVDKPYSRFVAVTVSGNYAYVGNDMDGLHIYDASDPANLVEVGATNTGQYVRSIAVSGNYAYLTCETDGLRIYSLGASAPPQLDIAIASTNAALLSWPAPSTALVVQRTAELGAKNWVDLTNTPIMVAGRNQVVLSVAAGSQFYRLRFP